jgi:predicted O-methyltransferase YrrM
MINEYIEKTLTGTNDSDRHLLVLFSIALAAKGKHFIELGVRSGTTTIPLKLAAKLNGAKLHSVDIDTNPFKIKKDDNWEFYQSDAVEFLLNWELIKKPAPDFVYIDDWHSYDHVKKELEILDRIVTPSTIIIAHDTMYGNTCPYYHADLTLKDGQWANGGPYRAISELNPQFWEFSTLPWSHGLTIIRKKYSNRITT